MTKNRDQKKESLVEIAVDPDILAKELALELEIDPLEQIDNDSFSKEGLNITSEYFVNIEIKEPFLFYYLY